MASVIVAALLFIGYTLLAWRFLRDTQPFVRLSEAAPEEEKGKSVKLSASGAADPHTVRQNTRWLAILIPVFGAALLAAAGGILNYNATNATTQAQLASIQKHQEEQDAAIAANTRAMRELLERLPKDYVPRWEHAHDEELVRQAHEEDEDRFARRQALLNDYRAASKPARK